MSLDFTQPKPIAEAVASLDRREPMATALGSAELQALPLDIRRRAFFSAKVESVRFLELAKKRLQRTVNQFGTNRDRASFIKAMQDAATDLGIRPPESGAGTLLDITSARRLGLIFDIQTGLARGEAAFLRGVDPDRLNAAPAQELKRVEHREEPRDWPTRWKAAGGELTDDGRMVALKTDPIWKRISRFGLPWPPFDFNSGMGVRDVRRRDAVGLGLVTRGERVAPVALDEFLTTAPAPVETPDSGPAPKAGNPQASVAGLPEETVDRLRDDFGDLVDFDRSSDDHLVLDEAAPVEFAERALSGELAPEATFDFGVIAGAGTSGGDRVTLTAKDAIDSLTLPGNGIAPDDWENVPAILWMPDEIERRPIDPDDPESPLVTIFRTFLTRSVFEVATQSLGDGLSRLVNFLKILR